MVRIAFSLEASFNKISMSYTCIYGIYVSIPKRAVTQLSNYETILALKFDTSKCHASVVCTVLKGLALFVLLQCK